MSLAVPPRYIIVGDFVFAEEGDESLFVFSGKLDNIIKHGLVVAETKEAAEAALRRAYYQKVEVTMLTELMADLRSE